MVIHTAQVFGAGAYGNVVKATLDGLTCAAKILHKVFLGQCVFLACPGLVERFEQECQILRDLNHPCIVQFLGTVQDHNTGPILLMELMKESLTQFLEISPTDIPYHVQVDISHDIALAVAYLHSNGIWHRDLSSNNILLNEDMRAKVTDFGMAMITGFNPDMTCRRLSKSPGIPAYMPPEALHPQPHYSEKIDIFSFGVLLVQIATRNFPDPTDAYILKEDSLSPTGEIYIPVPEIERRRADINKIPTSHGFLPIIINCLKNKSQDRPTAAELCQSLDELNTSTYKVYTCILESR